VIPSTEVEMERNESPSESCCGELIEKPLIASLLCD
jgi:hypothetical protein